MQIDIAILKASNFLVCLYVFYKNDKGDSVSR